jgi:hypothetical protein
MREHGKWCVISQRIAQTCSEIDNRRSEHAAMARDKETVQRRESGPQNFRLHKRSVPARAGTKASRSALPALGTAGREISMTVLLDGVACCV